MNNPTVNTHINPCFWIVFWNVDCFNSIKSNKPLSTPREEKVFYLAFNCPKILHTKAENVHVVKGLGLATVEKGELAKYNDFLKIIQEPDDVGYVIDIENHFTLIENDGGYGMLKKVVQTNAIATPQEKAYLASFIVLHRLRSPLYFQHLMARFRHAENPKLLALKEFKDTITDEGRLSSEILPIFHSSWTLYIFEEDVFPLSDVPIVKEDNLVIVTVSPRHVILIDVAKRKSGPVKYKKSMNPKLLKEVRQLIIKNTFLGLVFSNSKMLGRIQKSHLWNSRKRYLENMARN